MRNNWIQYELIPSVNQQNRTSPKSANNYWLRLVMFYIKGVSLL